MEQAKDKRKMGRSDVFAEVSERHKTRISMREIKKELSRKYDRVEKEEEA